MNQDSNTSPRPMVEGNWQCSQCNAPITKLPFTPDESRKNTLKCIDCFRKDRPEERGERKMFEGSWTCGECGKEINKMPFQPTEGRPIKCMDCFRSTR